jgi:hypothetical protein
MTARSQGDHFVYRRLHPFHWDSRRNRLETSAFRLRSNEATLSVYHADRQTPRGVLQICLDEEERKLHSTDETVRARAQAFFAEHGRTVESLVANGWRVARLPVASFLQRGFRVSEPDPIGHQDVFGVQERFRETSRELRDLAEILSVEECLSAP